MEKYVFTVTIEADSTVDKEELREFLEYEIQDLHFVDFEDDEGQSLIDMITVESVE